MEAKIREIFLEIEKIVEQHLNDGQYNLAEKAIFLLEDKLDLLKRKLKNKKKTKTCWIFFEKNFVLEDINLDNYIHDFFENMQFKFGSAFFDEVVFFKIEQKELNVIYFISTNPYKTIKSQNKESLMEIKNYVLKNIELFKHDIFKENIKDGEGLLIRDHKWDPYDVILKLKDYIIWFNNTVQSLEEIKRNREINQKEILNEIALFYQNLSQGLESFS
mgnify:CR=1 FL=1